MQFNRRKPGVEGVNSVQQPQTLGAVAGSRIADDAAVVTHGQKASVIPADAAVQDQGEERKEESVRASMRSTRSSGASEEVEAGPHWEILKGMLADFQEEVRQELESTNPRACEKLCESAGNMVWKFDDFDLKTEKAGQEGYDKLLSKAKRIRDSLRIELEEAQAERDKLSQLNDAAMEENAALKQEIDRLRQQLADARAAQAAVGPATTFQVAPPSAPPPLRQTTLSVNLPNQAAKL